MSNLDRNLTVLLHMKNYCKDIDEAFKMFGKDINKFINNSVFRNSVSMAIFQIGELTNHLTPEYKEETYNLINWNQLKGMRNRFAHTYGSMNFEIIYNTALNDIPILKDILDKEIKRLSNNS